MPTWTTPKTNWEGTDTFGRVDYYRIAGNTEYVASELGISYTASAGVAQGYVLTSKERNDITDTLNAIYDALYASWNRHYVLPRVDYGSAWNSKDLNGIEEFLLTAKEQIDGTINNNVEYFAGNETICGDTLSLGLL